MESSDSTGGAAFDIIDPGWSRLAFLPAEKGHMNAWLIAIGFILWWAVVVFLHHFRVWLLFYVVASVGGVYWFILIIGNALGFELSLAHSVAWAVHVLSNLIGIPTRIFESAPGVLLVLVVSQDVGWTILQIGVESSGLLEISVLASLLLFYPSWSLYHRGKVIAIGTLAVWSANVFRVLLIAVILNRMGKGSLVLAHTYFGKAIFFLLIVGIFWYLINKSTILDLRRRPGR